MTSNLQVDDQQLPLELNKEQKPATVQADASGDETVEELKRQIAERDKKAAAAIATAEAERRARLEAEARVGTATQEIEQYKTQAQTAEQKAVANYLEAANRESESAQRELEAALNAGEYSNVAKIQAKIAKTAAQIVQLETAKADIDAQVANPSRQVRVDVAQRSADPTEAFLGSFSARTQGWLRDHRNLIVQDGNGRPALSSKAMAAHYSALDEGITAESDEYFSFMEDRMNPRQSGDDVVDQPVQPRRQAPVAAPVSRDTPNSNGRPNTRIRLSPEQVEIARISGLTEAQYAENLQALKSEGRIGRTTH